MSIGNLHTIKLLKVLNNSMYKQYLGIGPSLFDALWSLSQANF